MTSLALTRVVVTWCLLSAPGDTGPVVRIETGDSKPRQPQLAIARDESVHLVFGSDKEIYHCGSTDHGNSFGKPERVAGPNNLALGMRRGPRIAATKDSIVVTAIAGERGGGQDGDVLAWQSSNHGKSWSQPVRVNDSDASAREGLHAMASGPNGDIYCVWLDLRNKGTEVFGAKSVDGGRTWSANKLIYHSPEGNVCECCHPSVTYDASGGLFVLWRNWLGGNRDMYYAVSNDGGESFGKAIKLGAGAWKLKACPMDGGAIAVRSSGGVYSVWRREAAVYLTSGGTSREMKLGDGEQPWLVATDSGPLPIWLSRRGGDLLALLPNQQSAIKLATGARDPVIAAGGGTALVTWESEADNRPAIYVRRLNLTDVKVK